MSEYKILKEIALELLEKYRLSETGLIWETSGSISEDITRLEYECNYMRKQIEKAAEPKKGKWTNAYDGHDGHVKCTVCFKTYDYITHAQYFNYCPNCGAQVEVNRNERFIYTGHNDRNVSEWMP